MEIDHEKLKREAKKLVELLTNPHYDLSTWNMSVGQSIDQLNFLWFEKGE